MLSYFKHYVHNMLHLSPSDKYYSSIIHFFAFTVFNKHNYTVYGFFIHIFDLSYCREKKKTNVWHLKSKWTNSFIFKKQTYEKIEKLLK